MLRKKANLSQADLAERLNVNQTAVSKWELGRTLPDADTLNRLADIFEVSIDKILGREPLADVFFPARVDDLIQRFKPVMTDRMNNIKKLRERKGIKQDELARLLNVTQGAVSGWETGRYNIDNEKLKAIANILETTTDELLGISYPGILPVELKKFPMLGTIAAGEPIIANEEYDIYISADASIKADFCLQVHGDSMINARICNGDIVFIKRQPDVHNGQIAAVLIGNEVTLKRVYKHPRQIVLQAENPLYPPIVINGSADIEISIIGLAVAFQSIVR